MRDMEIRDRVWQIMDQVEGFANTYFAFEYPSPRHLATNTTDKNVNKNKHIPIDLSENDDEEQEENDKDESGDHLIPPHFFSLFHPETVKIISCVASSGQTGIQGWHQLFIDAEKRQALVCAVICNVLVEQVFKHLFFGGTERDVGEMMRVQREVVVGGGKGGDGKFRHFPPSFFPFQLFV